MFNLNDAVEQRTSSEVTKTEYQKPGIHENVMISEVVLEHTNLNKVPYLRLITQGAKGEVGSGPKMYLGTEVKEGKKTSGWGLTARKLIDLVMSTHNVDESRAKEMIGSPASNEALVSKISALTVGRKFRGKFKGQYTQKGNIFAELDNSESMQVEVANTTLKYNEYYDVKPYIVNTYNSNISGSEISTDTTKSNDTNDMPF